MTALVVLNVLKGIELTWEAVELKILLAAGLKTAFLFLCWRKHVCLFCKRWNKCIENFILVFNVTPLEMFSKIVHHVLLRL